MNTDECAGGVRTRLVRLWRRQQQEWCSAAAGNPVEPWNRGFAGQELALRPKRHISKQCVPETAQQRCSAARDRGSRPPSCHRPLIPCRHGAVQPWCYREGVCHRGDAQHGPDAVADGLGARCAAPRRAAAMQPSRDDAAAPDHMYRPRSARLMGCRSGAPNGGRRPAAAGTLLRPGSLRHQRTPHAATPPGHAGRRTRARHPRGPRPPNFPPPPPSRSSAR